MMSAATDEILSDVFALLRERAGVNPDSLGVPGIAHAVRRRVSVSGAGSPHDYLHRLLVDPAEFQQLLEDLVVPETWFFRDVLAFRRLRAYLEDRRASGRQTVRALSVGCSTGEEVYSLAMALREAGLQPFEFHVLGVDVSRRSLELAQNGRFASNSFRELDEAIVALRQRWCEPVGESWRVRDELRSSVEFKCDNLAQPEFLAHEPPFQVVFCRNVLIYFHARARQVAVRNLRRLLSRDGILCSAPAEARLFSEAGFGSLGSECPFAFGHPGTLAEMVPTANSAIRQHGVSLPHPQAIPLPAPRPGGVPSASPPKSPGVLAVGDTGRDVRLSAARSTGEDFPGADLLDAAREAADNGRLEEAESLCGRMLSRNFASAEAHYLRGVVRQAQGQFSEAQQSLEKALYLNPKYYEALVQMMLLAERRGDTAAAANYRRRARQVAAREAD